MQASAVVSALDSPAIHAQAAVSSFGPLILAIFGASRLPIALDRLHSKVRTELCAQEAGELGGAGHGQTARGGIITLIYSLSEIIQNSS